jgi:hypothetical protein
MSGGIIYDTNFYAALEAEVNAFRKALTKRWREEVATAVRQSGSFKTAYHRYQHPYDGADLWDYWDPVNQVHLFWGSCEVITWVQGGQQGGIPSCPGRTFSPEMGYPPMTVADRNGVEVATPSEIACGMNSIMQHVEYWAYGEGTAVLGKLPHFDRHDQRAIEAAQQALIAIGGPLGLESAPSDAGFTPASNADLSNKIRKLIGQDGRDAGWFVGWTGLAADKLKGGFFASIAPTLHNQAGIAASLHNLYSARGTIIQEMRSGSLKILSDAGKALDATKEITTDLNPVWQTFQGMGTALSIAGGWNPPLGAFGASVQLIGIIGQNFAPKIKQTAYAHDVEAVMTALWSHLDEQAYDLFDRENDYNNGIHSLRDTLFGYHSFNLELYDLTENTATGDPGTRDDGFHMAIDTVLELADTCYECAEFFESQLIPKIADVQAADASLATADGSVGMADPKVKAMVAEYGEYLRTACGRLYLAGEQIKAAAQAYAATDSDAGKAFTSVMQDWDEPPAPSQAGAWAGDTDRSGWQVHIPGAPPYVNDTTPGGSDTGDQDYETEANR